VAFAAAVCVVLAGYNNLVGLRPWHRRWYPVVNGCAAAAALGVAAASGLSIGDLGLGRDRLGAGLKLGSAAAAPVVAGFGLAAVIPGGRRLLDDQRIAGLDGRQLAYQVLLRIPVGTVAWEEIAFRGVLQAALRRMLAEPSATAVGCVVFGLWHIRPAAEALAVNRLAAGRGARIFAVTAVAAGTAGAGALLCLLRERSGSLAAPVLLHLAANCAGPLASALARPRGLALEMIRELSSPPTVPRRPCFGLVEGAEADGAAELAGRERLKLAGHQRSAQDGHAAVQRDAVGEPEPGVAPGVPAEHGDLQDDFGVEDIAAGQGAAQRLGDRRLAGTAGSGDDEQREVGYRLRDAAAGQWRTLLPRRSSTASGPQFRQKVSPGGCSDGVMAAQVRSEGSG